MSRAGCLYNLFQMICHPKRREEIISGGWEMAEGKDTDTKRIKEKIKSLRLRSNYEKLRSSFLKMKSF